MLFVKFDSNENKVFFVSFRLDVRLWSMGEFYVGEYFIRSDESDYSSSTWIDF